MASQRRNRERHSPRRSGTKEPKKRFLVVCEGAVTEAEYIKGFSAWCRNPLVTVEILDVHGVPRTLVEAAKKAQRAALNEAKRHDDDNLSFDEVWCVFDVDEHPRVNDACQMARNNAIHVAVSNPCFELCLLLHFRDSPGAQSRHAVQKMTKTYLPGFDKHVVFEHLAPKYPDAKERAQRVQTLADADGEPIRNPATGVFRLTVAIERA